MIVQAIKSKATGRDHPACAARAMIEVSSANSITSAAETAI